MTATGHSINGSSAVTGRGGGLPPTEINPTIIPAAEALMPWTRTSRHPTPCCAWSPTLTLVVIGDQDNDHASADALAATLLNARFTRVPGNHFRGAAKIRTEAAISRS
jgi:hypothetical protein